MVLLVEFRGDMALKRAWSKGYPRTVTNMYYIYIYIYICMYTYIYIYMCVCVCVCVCVSVCVCVLCVGLVSGLDINALPLQNDNLPHGTGSMYYFPFRYILY